MHGKIKIGRKASNLRKKRGRIPPIDRKGSCKIKMTEGYTEGFRQFQKQTTEVYEVIFFDM